MTEPLKKKALIEFMVWIVIAATFYGFSFQFSGKSSSTFLWGPAFWPRLFAIIVALAALLQLYDNFRKLPRGNLIPKLKEPEGDYEWIRTLGIFVVPLIFVFALPRIGFYVATPVFLVMELYILGERNFKRIAGVTLGVFAGICLVFTTIFYVGLPIGNWPVFYEINSAIVQLLRIG